MSRLAREIVLLFKFLAGCALAVGYLFCVLWLIQRLGLSGMASSLACIVFVQLGFWLSKKIGLAELLKITD